MVFGWGTKVYVWKRSGPSNVILHRFCLTKGSTLTSQDHDPRSVVYVSKPTRAIWRYLLSEFRALLCCSLSQYINDYFAARGAEGHHVNKRKTESGPTLDPSFFTDQSNQCISLSRTLIGPVIFQLSSVKQISCTHPFPKSNSGLRNNVIFLRKFKVQKIYLNSVKTWSQFRLGFEIYWQNSSLFNIELNDLWLSEN